MRKTQFHVRGAVVRMPHSIGRRGANARVSFAHNLAAR
ncbi:hypothetical protein RAN3_1151 [plant metagenome]|uniref:Uncharacterized protein n=1 Tax=plant metagenome TaxID=1297885 RepID=A0A484V0P1_9ZZZZ